MIALWNVWHGCLKDMYPSGHTTLERCRNLIEFRSLRCFKLNFNVVPTSSAAGMVILYVALKTTLYTDADHLRLSISFLLMRIGFTLVRNLHIFIEPLLKYEYVKLIR